MTPNPSTDDEILKNQIQLSDNIEKSNNIEYIKKENEILIAEPINLFQNDYCRLKSQYSFT